VTIYVAHEGQKAAQVAVPPFGNCERFTCDRAEHESIKDEPVLLAANQNDNPKPQRISILIAGRVVNP
jgi:hypothetical protein